MASITLRKAEKKVLFSARPTGVWDPRRGYYGVPICFHDFPSRQTTHSKSRFTAASERGIVSGIRAWGSPLSTWLEKNPRNYRGSGRVILTKLDLVVLHRMWP